jgi:hypothetical protein
VKDQIQGDRTNETRVIPIGPWLRAFSPMRREFACRQLESGAQQHDLHHFLGHANVTMTSRYLANMPVCLEQALARMEGGAIRTRFAQTDESAEPSIRTLR